MKKLMLCMLFAVLPIAAVAAGGWDAAWSPDGKQIAFTSGSPLGVPNIWIMDADGRDPRKLTALGGRAPQWMSDSNKIAFVTLRSGKPQYFVTESHFKMPSDSQLQGIPADAQGIVWSPDGTQVAYALPGKDGASRDLWVASADGSNARGVTTNFWVRQYAWSPDGGQLAVVIGRAIGSSLWIVKPDGRTLNMLYDGFCSSPTYSPDGKHLIFAVPARKEGHRILCFETATGKRLLVPVKSYDGKPVSWSPDGQKILFASETRTEAAVWIAGITGRQLIRVTPPEIQAFDPLFSPDGKRILFSATVADSQGVDLFACGSDTNIPFGAVKGIADKDRPADLKAYIRLTKSRMSEFSPVLSPDGKRMAISVLDKGMGIVYLADARGGGRKKLMEFDPSLGQAILAWSPDGKQIAAADGSKVQVFPASGGQPKVTLTTKGESTVNWSPDSKSLYFMEWHDGKAGVSAYNLDASETKELTKGGERSVEPVAKKDQPVAPADAHAGLGLAAPVPTEQFVKTAELIHDLYPSVSPDGRTVAFIRESQVWLIGADGKNEKQLTKLAAPESGQTALYHPAWSVDGKRIVFQAGISDSNGLTWEISTVDAASGEVKKIVTEPVASEYGCNLQSLSAPPCFTPDGKWVAFTSVEGGASVSIIPADGGKALALFTGPAALGSIGGGKLAFVNFAGDDAQVVVREITETTDKHR